MAEKITPEQVQTHLEKYVKKAKDAELKVDAVIAELSRVKQKLPLKPPGRYTPLALIHYEKARKEIVEKLAVCDRLLAMAKTVSKNVNALVKPR